MVKKKANQLGRVLIKDRFGHSNRRKVNNDTMLHTIEVQDGYDWGRLNLQSVTEESSFQEFLRTAELAGTEFQAEKLNVTFVNPKSKVGLLTGAERIAIEKKHLDNKDLLKIPRRPKWTATMTADELKLLENESFLTWRRNLAQLQEQDGMLLTPYEKNLDFWRQLWRVVERSDVVVQIVDARNPLVFRSEDLEQYVKEVDANKQNMILLNKSDFLTAEQRQYWAEYFDKEGMRVIFFSALEPEESALDPVEEEGDSDSNSSEDEEEATNTITLEEIKTEIKSLESKLSETELKLEVFEDILRTSTDQLAPAHDSAKNNPNVLTRAELIAYFKGLHSGLVTIGFCGYPNVGKSSTINTLLKEKKVSVSSTPGKTKHFQTLYLDPELLLCDCPGLVMPTFCTTKADMVLNGILPIDQMRDHVPPINLLCTLVPRHVLEDKYGIMIAKPLDGEDPNRPPYSEEFLLAYSYNRGFMTANGQPDQSRGARLVIKEYVCGKLLYCHAPPGIDATVYHTFPERRSIEKKLESLPPRQQRAIKTAQINKSSNDLDKDFFARHSLNSHIQGRTNFPHIRTSAGEASGGSLTGSTMSLDSVATSSGMGMMVLGKQKHAKRPKREKLRRQYQHLDMH